MVTIRPLVSLKHCHFCKTSEGGKCGSVISWYKSKRLVMRYINHALRQGANIWLVLIWENTNSLNQADYLLAGLASFFGTFTKDAGSFLLA